VADEKLPAPVPRENLIALRDRREAVIGALTEHFAKDVLDVDEYDRRIDLAHRARTLAELDDIVVDLAPVASTAMVPQPSTDLALESWPEKKRWMAIFGGIDKKGRWTVPRKMRATAIMGGGSLDFRDAVIAPGVTELHITAIMGGFEIIVPPWLAVECDATAIFGGFEELERGHGEPDPGRSLLRITGLAIMGGVSIETRMPGESRRQAKKRHRHERKLAERAQDALPAARVRSLPSGDKPK
jgi:hypothetical protein